MSDHKIVSLSLNIDPTDRGNGYWKINSSILLDENYTALIKRVINDFLVTNTRERMSPHTLWETLKCVIRGETIKFCVLLKKKRNRRQVLLESKLDTIESQLNTCSNSEKDNLLTSMNNSRNDLDQLVRVKASGAAIRSRARWMEYGEKNSKYFLGLEKWHNDKKSIKSLRNSQGTLLNDQQLILQELVNFYESLYFDDQQLTETECCNFIKKLPFPNIDEDEKAECDKPITESECFKAIFQLANNKSPGLDGFSIEFYKMFWQDLKNLFMECVNYSWEKKELCNSQYEGLITLIPKPGKDCLNVSNYRPITLLNCDYKIISKVINNRLCCLLPKLIKNDQNGFIKGRNIGDNIRLMLDVIDYANYKNGPGAVLSIDLCKAFDSLKWPFIFATLKLYGFGSISWIKILYKNPKCRIVNNSFLSPFFYVHKGVRQGDPLSPTIFVLCVEYLAVMLRHSEQYQGFEIERHRFKVSLFADDTVIYLNGNPSQFNYVFDILDSFGKKSGCKVNLSKSYAFYVGSSKKNKVKPFLSRGLSWPNTAIKYLGVHIPFNEFNELSLFEVNFANILHDIQSIFNLWSARGLTLIGKITVLKTLIIPKLVHKASYLPVQLPDSFIKQLNQKMFKFIWGSKWEKIGRSQLCCDVEEGGAKMIDVKQYLMALKFKWIYKLFNENYTAPWKTIENLCFEENLFFCVLRSNCKLNSMIINKLVFLRSSKCALITAKSILHASESIDAGNRFLWLNKKVRYRNKPMFIDEFFEAGIYDF